MNSTLLTRIKEKQRPVFFIILFFALLAYYLHVPTLHYDDLYFRTVLHGSHIFNDLISFMIIRYHTWSSRILLEGLLVLVAKHFIIWKIINTFVLVAFVWIVDSYLNRKKDIHLLFATMALTFLIPIGMFSDAGWMATTVNYLWPTTFGLFAIYPLINNLDKRKTKPLILSGSILLLSFACNQEQINFFLIGITFLILLRKLHDHKKVIVPICYLTIEFAFAIVTLIAPGNQIRFNKEVITWFPDYNHLSLLRKLEIGFMATSKSLLISNNIIFLVFSIILGILIYNNHRDHLLSAISLIPLAWSSFLVLYSASPSISIMTNGLAGNLFSTVTTHGATRLSTDLLFMIIICSSIVGVLDCFKNRKFGLIAGTILVLGVGSKMILAFSPTVWASGERTSLILNVSLIFIIVMMLQELARINFHKSQFIINYLVAFSILFALIVIA